MSDTLIEGFKEDGLRSIADKIHQRLSELPAEDKFSVGRWAWELLQNAKDSSLDGTTVNIRMALDSNRLIFSHTGNAFTELDIRGLINVITSKEAIDGMPRRKTGKFGTGFLTTHLLSTIVDVEILLLENNGSYSSTYFTINRSATSTKDLIPDIENTALQAIKNRKAVTSPAHGPQIFNTTFTYRLDAQIQREKASNAIKEFIRLLPYVLAFNPTIGSIEIDAPEIGISSYKLSCKHDSNKDVYVIECESQLSIQSNRYLKVITDENKHIQIAFEIDYKDSVGHILPFENTPKLFCDFPLLGSESFQLPVVINSPLFEPLKERNGIWLNSSEIGYVTENKRLLYEGVQLFINFLKTQSTSGPEYEGYFNILNTKMPTNLEERIFDSQWYKNNIQTPIRSNAIELKLAKNELGQFIKLKELRVPEPTLKKEEVNSIWEYYSVLFPERICKFEEIKYWQIIMWNDFPYLDCKRIVAAAKSFENLSDLSSKINKQPNETVLWLNNLYKLIYTLSGNDLQFRENELIPNLDGNFRKLQELNIDGVGQPILLQILQLFGTNWKDKILYPNSCVDTELRFKTFNFSNVKVDIEKALNNLKDKSTTINEATIMLVQWLEKNENLAVEHFKELYKNRADLFVGAIPDKDSLYAIFRDGVDLSKVKKIIEFVSLHPDIDFDNVQDNMNQYKLLPDTTNNIYKEALELLVAELRKKNVSTIHELLDVLERIKDGELIKRADNGNSEIQILPEERAKLFQSLLAEAIQTTIPHLKSHGYIFSDELDQNSPSVFRVIRNNETIKIIIRPAHGGKYKLFYDGEFDALEAKSTELWLSDGRNVFQETLGLLVKRMLAEGTRFIPTSGFLPGNSI